MFGSPKPQPHEWALWRPSGEGLEAGKSLITLHLLLWKCLGAAEGKRNRKQRSQSGLLIRLLTGSCPRGSPADLALGLWQGLLNHMSTHGRGQATEEKSEFYVLQFCTVKANIPVKCELIGSCNWRVVQLWPPRCAVEGCEGCSCLAHPTAP